MTDKLYARKTIRIPNFKNSKRNKVKLLVFFIILSIFFSIISFINAAFPIFKSSCESAAGSLATHITNEAVTEVIKEYTYNDFMNIQKESNGKINLIEANVVNINLVISKISDKIQKRIDESPKTNVYINMGSVSGISGLKSIGPNFDIQLETAGRISSKISTEFEAVGINQTLHRIYVDLNTDIGILTPYGSFTRKFETTILLSQAIIVGEIPETYYDFNGSYTNEEDVAMEAM